MILLHHMNAHAHAWDQFAALMSNAYRVLALDMRGHGDSQWSRTGSYKTADLASDVGALMDELGLERAIILGGSSGGRVALVYAGQHPDRTMALIMEDVGPVRSQEGATNMAAQGEAEELHFDTLDRVVEYMKAHPGGHSEHRPEEAWRHLAQYATRREDNGILTWKRDTSMYRNTEALELWDYVERIECPFLLILGADSDTVSPAHRDRMAETASNITIVTMPGAGHIVVHDKLPEYERAVREFLSAHADTL